MKWFVWVDYDQGTIETNSRAIAELIGDSGTVIAACACCSGVK